MKLVYNVLVITPTIGKDTLMDAAKSVLNQTYPNVHHLFVVDGPDYAAPVNKMLYDGYGWPTNAKIMYLPWNVGKDGGSWYGHRVYATIPKLIPEKYHYVLFLDEDNFYEPEHVETCVELAASKQLDWSHSLRNVVDKNGKFLINDDCESLGKYPIYGQIGNHLVDTSSYCFKREWIRNYCPYWDSGWGGDRRFLSLIADKSKWAGTGKYTLNYRLDGNPGSVTQEFFEIGNKRTDQSRPWRHNG